MSKKVIIKSNTLKFNFNVNPIPLESKYKQHKLSIKRLKKDIDYIDDDIVEYYKYKDYFDKEWRSYHEHNISVRHILPCPVELLEMRQYFYNGGKLRIMNNDKREYQEDIIEHNKKNNKIAELYGLTIIYNILDRDTFTYVFEYLLGTKNIDIVIFK